MTNRQARLLFGLLADLSTARNASRMSGRRAVENVAAGAKMAPGEVRAILDHLDDEIAKASAEMRARGSSFNDAEEVARMVDIVRTVTDDEDGSPIGPGSATPPGDVTG
jgi:hypothetical protein